jgi:HEPN domain-containing protein
MRNVGLHRLHSRDDRHLGRVFIRNAEGFFHGTDELLPLFPDNARHFMAIAVELALKAYLLHRGISDDWNRIHVRHDLTKALKSAKRAGFDGVSPRLATIAAALSPYYKTHTLPDMPAEVLASIDWVDAHRTIASLLAAVRAIILRDNASAPIEGGR